MAKEQKKDREKFEGGMSWYKIKHEKVPKKAEEE